MRKSCKNRILLLAALAPLTTVPAFAEEMISPIPYGGYCKNGKCGCYGAKATIKTAVEARRIIEEFLSGHDLWVGAMIEHPRFFRAELVDGNGIIRDVVIVDKINGRVRSIY